MANEKLKAELLAEISALQEIQKTHPQASSAWMQASELLAPKFKMMAALGEGVYQVEVCAL